MSKTFSTAFLLLVIVCSAAALAAGSPCTALASRISPGGALAPSLTETLCAESVARNWLTAEDLPGIATPADLRLMLQKRSGLDLLDLGQAMFESFARTAAAIPASGDWIMRDTENYRLVARSGSAAARDLNLIAAQAEQSRGGIARAFGIDDALAARKRILSSVSLPHPLNPEPSQRVVIFLYANRQDDFEKHVGRNSMGSTQFSATIEGGRGRLRPTIHVLYFNPFSLAVVEHEIAHATVMLAAFDGAAIDLPLENEKELKTAFFKGYRPMPAFVNEGIGDYGLYYAGFYPAWGLLGSPESLASALLAAGKLPSIDKLLRSKAMMHAREHKAFSLAAATFLRYLQQSKGPEVLNAWLFGDQASPAAFKTRFGMDLTTAQRGWAQWLQERAKLGSA